MGGGGGWSARSDAPAKVTLPAETIARISSDYGVGIDCHSRFIQVCVLAQQSEVITRWEAAYATTWEQLCEARDWVIRTLSQALGERAPSRETLSYTLESTGTYHCAVMLSWRGDPHLVNPLLASKTIRKTDVLDARQLATHAMMGMWPRSIICTPGQEAARICFGHRRALVRERTRLGNTCNNIVLRYGHTFVAHELKKWPGHSGVTGPHILPVLAALGEGKLPMIPGVSPLQIPLSVGEVIRRYVDRIETLHLLVKKATSAFLSAAYETEFVCRGGELVRGDKLVKLLITVPGVSPLLAATWLAQVIDAGRFKTSQQVAAFAGFDPSLMISAGKTTSHTRRRGNKVLHYQIKLAAGLLINKHNEPFGDWGYNMARLNKRGGWNRACGAVGRKMVIAMWVCHRDQVAFDYDKYRFWRAPEVPDVDIKEVGLPARERNVLVDHGYATTAPLTAAFYKGELADLKGVGPTCLVLIRRWIHKFRDSSSAGR